MAFQFSLLSVLRARVIAEEREERLLQKILIEIAQSTLDMDQVREHLVKLNSRRIESVSVLSDAKSVHEHYGQVQELLRVRGLLEDQLIKLNQLKDQQLAIYNAARQNRELLSDMSDNARGEYDVDLARREQSMLDDNFNARRLLR
jgi:flagellar export protein FliJ